MHAKCLLKYMYVHISKAVTMSPPNLVTLSTQSNFYTLQHDAHVTTNSL